ncbi:MAG TPA: 6-phosphogluconolactonase [Candidatus Angelobacter sp.]|nr:6-phosphogluconolactonase [Candidatus Angelobacter sp.]
MLSPTVFPDHEAMSHAAADLLAGEFRRKPDTLLCLATGGTPRRSYELLAARCETGAGLFDQLRVLKLDEWGGIPMENPATCENFLRKSLVGPLRLESRYVGFHSRPADPVAECDRIRLWLAGNGPIDLCVLGLGVNGHIGFNEPADALQPHAHVATLSGESLAHSMITNERVRPDFGLTLGMADLLQARQILLLVSGRSKRAPLQQLLSGRISTHFPGSFLWLHEKVSLFCDRAALD